MIKLTAFKWVPEFAQGLVKDIGPRWALEEAGIPYETRLIGNEEKNTEDFRRMQPFGQVPVLEEEGVVMFESGAIALHIAKKSEVLWPADIAGQARARTWVFAALTSIGPVVRDLNVIDLFNSDEEWGKMRRPGVIESIQMRLGELNKWMEGREYLEDRFTVGDLMMTTVLRGIRHTDILEKEFPLLDAYRKRCEDRPAFKRALEAQLKPFAENLPEQL